MRRLLIAVSFLGLATAATGAHAALSVFACEPEWGAVARVIGGEDVTVDVATTALQDPHHIQARPSLIAKVRRADLVACTGAELEVGWLPVLLRQAANGRVQPGQPGYFSATDYVTTLEKPTRLDRAEGDVHPYGNPHIQTDPRRIGQVAAALATRLAEIDPGNAAAYQARYQDFAERWQVAMRGWEAKAAPLRGVAVVTQHKGWVYLEDWLGLKEVATLEPKPGIPPSAAYLAQVLDTLKTHPARMVIRAAYQDPRPSEWIAGRTSMPAVELPFTVGGSAAAGDLFGLFDDTVDRLLRAGQ
jgi:zinc/manganese transport system substrate-binding protein